VSVLEWILLIEAIVLVIATIFWGVALFIARNYPDDPIYVFTKSIWMTFLYPAPDTVLRGGKGGFEMRPRGGRRQSEEPAPPKTAKQEKEEAMYGRVPKGADGVVHTANLNVTVLPHSEKDEVLGRTSDGIELQVTAAAEDGASNKAVIQLVSKALGVKPYQVTLTKGHYQTRKAVAVTGMEQDQLDARLNELGS
jgi:uncharacterized protein YggU (UPF0235/DUF167 family)